MLTTAELTSILVRVKARLAFGAQDRKTALLHGIGVVIGVIGVLGGIVFIVQTGSAEDTATQIMLVFTAMSLSWAIFSIAVGSGEAVLDPGKFAIFPVSSRQLTIAFLAAAFVGVLAPGTAIVTVTSAVHAPSVAAAAIIVIGAVCVTLVCVLSGRLGLALMSSLVRRRGAREFAAVIAGMIGVVGGLVPQFAISLGAEVTLERRELAREIVRWLPWGWGPEGVAAAIEGRLVRAVLLVGLSAVLAVVLGELWRRLMLQILTTRPAASEATSIDGGLVPRILQPLGRSPVVAAASRSLRQLRRDPREFLEMVAFLPLVFITALPAVEAIRDGEPAVVLSTAGIGVGLGMTTLNMFGADGRSFGVDALALGDITPVIFGKAISRILVGLPLVLLAAVVLAAITNGWAFLLPGISIAITAMLAMAAVGMYVSVRFAFPLPEKAGAAGASNAGGCAVGIIRGVSIAVALVVAAVGTVPVGLISALISPILGTLAGLVSLVYGFGVFWFLGRRAGKRATEGTPELYQTLSAAPG